jgi:hypothetical protein
VCEERDASRVADDVTGVLDDARRPGVNRVDQLTAAVVSVHFPTDAVGGCQIGHGCGSNRKNPGCESSDLSAPVATSADGKSHGNPWVDETALNAS